MLTNKKILLGISGGIAAYKSCEIIRKLQQKGAIVKVIPTPNALNFITTTTLSALSHNEVHFDTFDKQNNQINHIDLANWADLIVIAPATANTIAKINYGIADNLLTNIILASKSPLLIAPAMNENMYTNKATTKNIQDLKDKGVLFEGPNNGYQACGINGIGRMSDPQDIVKRIEFLLIKKINKKVVITAGPTIEQIDPVRFISNFSSGKMGYSLAEASINNGLDVTLISGPTNLPPPNGVTFIQVYSAQDMLNAAKENIINAHCFIGCAAVADYKIKNYSQQKIKKENNIDELTINLIKNPDIISEISKSNIYTVGFAAETENVIEHAKKKIQIKNLDMIIANDVSNKNIGFGSDNNKVTIILKDGKEQDIPIMNKKDLANVIIKEMLKQMCEIKK